MVTSITKLKIIWYFSVPRTWLYEMLSFFFGFYLASNYIMNDWRLWLGLIIFGPLGCGATNFINMRWDTVEDKINKPERVDYIKYITPRHLTALTYGCYSERRKLLIVLKSFTIRLRQKNTKSKILS